MADPTKIVITAEDRTGAAFASVSGGMAKLADSSGHLKEALAGLGVAVSLGGMVEKFRQTVEAADALNDMSQRVGIAVKELAGYNLAAKQSGTSMETLAKGIKSLSGYMVEHGDALKKAGISATDSSGAVKQLSDVFKNLPDGIEKTALATKLFGKAGMEMIPMLNMGSEGLDKAAKKSEKYAQMMGELAPKADEFNDSLADLSAMSAGLGNSIANDLLPHLNNIVRAMIEAKKEGGLLQAVWVGLGGVAAEALAPAEETISSLTVKLEAAKKALSARQSDSSSGFGGALNNWINASQLKTAQEEVDKLTGALGKLTAARDADTQAKAASAAREKAEADAKAAAADKAAKTLLGNQQAEETAKAYETLIKSIRERIAVAQEESRAQSKLTEGEKEYAKFLAASKFAHDAKAKALFNELIVQERANQARAEVKKLLDDASKAYAEQIDQINKNTDSLVDETQKIRDHSYELLNGKEAYDAMLSARQDSIIATQEEALRIAEIENATGRETEAIRKNVAALKDKRAALAEAAGAEAVHKQQEEWKHAWEETDRLAREVFTDWAMEGGSAAKKIGDALKKALLSAIYEATLKPLAFQVFNSASSALGMPTGALNGVSSAFSTASGLANAGGMFSGFSTGFSSMAGEMAAGSNFVGPSVALANGSIGAGAAAAETVGASAAGAMSSVAAAAPWIAAAVIAADAAGLFGKRGGPQSGQYGDISASGYKSSYTMSGGDSLGNQALAQSAYNQVASLYAMAGKQVADLTIGQGYKLDPSGSASGVAYRNISVGGKTITGGTFDGNNGAQWVGGNSDGAGAAAYLGKLTTSEIKALVDAIGDSGLSTTIEKLSANFEDLADGMAKYATAQAVQKTLSETLRQSTLSDSEKLAETQKNLAAGFSSIGVAVPKSAEEFRALVDGLDLTTKAAQDQLAAMNGLSASFLEVAAAQKAAEQTRAGWQIKLDIAQGKYTEEQISRFFQLINTQDEATKSLMQQVWAMEDQAAAAKEAAAALDAAAASAAAAQEKAAAIAAKQRDLDIQLLDATGQTSAATAARRADALKALDNDQQRATQMQIWSAQDAAEANAKAAEAAQQAAQAAQQAAQAAQQAAQEQARAQQQIRDEWQRTADSILNTIDRLRGDVASPAQSYASAQADFSIATAAARAGDQTAASKLPQLAQNVVDLGKAIAVTRVDQQLLSARTIASLTATLDGMRKFGIEVPAFAAGGYHSGGLRLVGENGPELEATGSARIFNFDQTRALLQGSSMAEELRAVRAELVAVKSELASFHADNSAENRAIAGAAIKTAKTFGRFDDNDALIVRVVA